MPIMTGWVECRSRILDNVIPAGAQGNVSAVPLYRVCGHRYPTGAPSAGTPICANPRCGVYSYGTCVQCGSPGCFEHLYTRDGRTLCGRHAAEVDGEKERREEEKRLAGIRRFDDWEAQAADALAAIPDPIERVVRGMAAELPAIYNKRLRELIPKPDDYPPNVIAQWFVGVVRAPLEEVEVDGRTMFGGYKKRLVPGWNFIGGSTVMGSSAGSDDWWPLPVAILRDGTVWPERDYISKKLHRFNPAAFRKMVDMAELKPLGLPPRPWFNDSSRNIFFRKDYKRGLKHWSIP